MKEIILLQTLQLILDSLISDQAKVLLIHSLTGHTKIPEDNEFVEADKPEALELVQCVKGYLVLFPL